MLSLFRFCQFWMEDELEWLVQSILGTSLEDLFIICLTKFLTQFLDSACDVIITHVLLILDERYLFWMKGKMRWLVPSILRVLLENSFTIWRKERFGPIFVICTLCVMLSFLRFYQFWLKGELEWLVHTILGALWEDWFIEGIRPYLTLKKR